MASTMNHGETHVLCLFFILKTFFSCYSWTSFITLHLISFPSGKEPGTWHIPGGEETGLAAASAGGEGVGRGGEGDGPNHGCIKLNVNRLQKIPRLLFYRWKKKHNYPRVWPDSKLLGILVGRITDISG